MYFRYDKQLPYLDMLVVNGNDFLVHTNEDKDVMVAIIILHKEKGEPWQTAVYWFGEKTVFQENVQLHNKFHGLLRIKNEFDQTARNQML